MVSIISNKFAVVSIEFLTVNRGDMMTRIHIWSAMIYGSLQAEFMETKHNDHIHRSRIHIFGTIGVYVSKTINNDNQIS